MDAKWFELDDRDFMEMVVLVFMHVKAETDKAWLIKFPKREHWFPKSQCKLSHSGDMILVPKWLYKKMLQGKEVNPDDPGGAQEKASGTAQGSG